MLLGIPGDNTFSNYQEANRALWRLTLLPQVDRVLAGLTGWLGEAFGDAVTLLADRDALPALAAEREALWTRLDAAVFLTTNEKRAQVGLDPVEGGEGLAATQAEGAPPRPFDRSLADLREAKGDEAEARPDLDTVIVKVWRTQGDGTVRDSHVAADGQVRLEDEPFDVGTAKLREPRDPEGPPEETFNCRCILERCPISALTGEDRKRAEERLQLAQRRRGGPSQAFTAGQELARAQWFNALDTIRRHNPADPILTFVAPPRFVPSNEQVVRARETARLYEETRITIHGSLRMSQRNVPLHRVVEAIRDGEVSQGNIPGRVVYELPASRSSNGRGLQVVIETRTQEVVTVICRGRKFPEDR